MDLASLGSWGKFPGNIARDAERLIKRQGVNVESYLVRVPLYKSDGLGTTMSSVHVLLPHEMFAWCWSAGLGESHFYGDNGRHNAIEFGNRSRHE